MPRNTTLDSPRESIGGPQRPAVKPGEPTIEAAIGVSEGDDYYYSDKWQVVEDRVGGEVKSQYVWSERYIDALVLRDRDTDPETSHMDERLYVQQDANFNTTAVTDTSGTVLERYVIGPYGGRSFRAADWTTSGVNPVAGNYAWLYLFQGGRYDNTTAQYNFRNRDHSVTLGRPIQADPVGYPDGMNRYEWEGSNPVVVLDPQGLQTTVPTQPATQPSEVHCPPSRDEQKAGLAVPVDTDGDGEPDGWEFPTARLPGDERGDFKLVCRDPERNFYVKKGDQYLHRCPYPNGQNHFQVTKSGGYAGSSTDPATGETIYYADDGHGKLNIVVTKPGAPSRSVTIPIPIDPSKLLRPEDVGR